MPIPVQISLFFFFQTTDPFPSLSPVGYDISVSGGTTEGTEINSRRPAHHDGDEDGGVKGGSSSSSTSSSSKPSSVKSAEPSKLDELVLKLKKARADADPARLHLDLTMLQGVTALQIIETVSCDIRPLIRCQRHVFVVPMTSHVFEERLRQYSDFSCPLDIAMIFVP